MEDVLDLIPNTADGVVAVDREQRILLWNEAAEALLGFTAEEVLGRFCYEVIGSRDELGRRVCHRGCLDTTIALRQELVPTRNLLVRTKAGREVWLSVGTAVVPSRRREPCVLVHLLRDVTRQKALELCDQPQILVVEPEPDIACLLRMIFESARFAVLCAEDLGEARAALARPRPPDLVILDPLLPDGDGLDLCRELTATRPSLPILVLTTQAATRDAALAAGARRFMTKPFEPEELEAEAARLLAAGSGDRRSA